MSYPTLKALHLIFVISWFAGLFYIFRLYVYHIENWQFLEVRRVLSTMERKLLLYIMLPASIGALGFGVMMLYKNSSLIKMPWIHMKLSLVLLLFAYHGYSYYVYKQLRVGRKILTSKQCRVINEVPTVILILVSLLVFIKPVL